MAETQPVPIFPSASGSIVRILHGLSRSTLSNRLHSIAHDASFVTRLTGIAPTAGLPLIANERCGSWYMAPSLKAGSAYFKSTDGHWGQWGFSLRRLNLNVLEICGKGAGCIIVDSTRGGKRRSNVLVVSPWNLMMS